MQRIRSNLVGIDRGDTSIFSDFENGGEMWTGKGPRERRRAVQFSESFAVSPVVQASISLWDADTSAAVRAEVSVDSITPHGCELVFRTWGDSRFARMRINWMAIGELADPDAWDLY